MLEIEKKAHLQEPLKVLNILKSRSDLEYQGYFYKSDLYFTSKLVILYEDLKLQKYIFRVRYLNKQIFLTLKYKTLIDNTEVNQELEVLVDQNNTEQIENFLLALGLSINQNFINEILNSQTPEDWKKLWVSQGFYFLLAKEKKTELFILNYENHQSLSIEWNEITHLGYFIEIEGLTENSDEVDMYIQLINKQLEFLGIPKEQEEPKLYLELLFLQEKQCE